MTETLTSPLRLLALLALWLLMSLGIAQAATETITYFHNDVAGTPILATDASGSVVWKENYQPYGSRINNASGGDNSQWFTGKPYDANTGLSYFGARYYDPVIGRFTGMDPAPVDPGNIYGLNRYSYGNNNPYRYVDPDGNDAVDVIKGGYDWVVGMPGRIWDRWENPSHRLQNGPENAGAAAAAMLGGVAPGTTQLAEARAQRDALAAELAPLKGKAPATVTGGYNVKTGEVAARACGGGKCAEDHVVEALGGVKEDVRFTEAIRPRTGAEVPVCQQCEPKYGRGAFPPNTRFKSDERSSSRSE